MARAGKALEQLVEHLERALAADENATIKAPSRLIDKVTGDTREFDVVVTVKVSHHLLVTAIECRDWERPLDVTHIEAYQTKCDHCDIHSKVIVSPVGFTAGALKKGQFLGIRCLKLSELEKLSWVKASEVGIRWRSVQASNWVIDPKDSGKELADLKQGDLELCFPFGLPFHEVYLENLLAKAIESEDVMNRTPGSIWKENYRFPDNSVRLFHRLTGKIFECVISVEATIRLESAKGNLSFFEYEEFEGSKIAKGATATLTLPGVPEATKVMLLEEPDGSRKLVLINPGRIKSASVVVQEEKEEK